MGANPTTMKRIPVSEMQKMFNEGAYWDKAKSGELTSVTLENRHPSLTAAHEPFCTQSQMISYSDTNNQEIARVHQYLRSDGTIGASGKPDPKRLFKDGTLYRLEKKPQSTSESISKIRNPPFE